MGRVKKAPEASKVEEETSPIQTVTQTRAKRTPKPNPKYSNESIIATPKIESSESTDGSTDIELKLPESKIVKSITKKVLAKNNEEATTKTPLATVKGKGAIKKQKIEFDDDEKTKDADEVPLPSPTPRTTRSGKATGEGKEEIKIGNDSVAIVDVSSIITTSDEPVKITRGSAGRKRQANDSVQTVESTAKEESPKKKKEEDKVSLITTRKSYMPLTPAANKKVDEKIEKNDEDEKKVTVSEIKTRRTIVTPHNATIGSEKKPKIEIIKASPSPKAILEPKKIPVVGPRKELITKIISPNLASGLATKIINNSSVAAKPAPRLLNTMITPKGAKESPNVKLSGDGTDRKVFSIEMSDGSVVEKRALGNSPVKMANAAVKENIATINKPQPAALLKNKLESELNRMRMSANNKRPNVLPAAPTRYVSSLTTQTSAATSPQARRITKFESWYVIDVKNQDVMKPLKHNHNFSLIRMGNDIKEIKLPSAKWDHKITLQKRIQKGNSTDGEVYTGDVTDKSIEGDKHKYEPNSILFKRSHRDNNRLTIDRSLIFKANTYSITMNGKECHLLGAPSDIKTTEDIEILLNIIDRTNLSHSCVEPKC